MDVKKEKKHFLLRNKYYVIGGAVLLILVIYIHYLKITLRGLFKDKIFSLINIIGLAIAIACCFLLIFWVKFEMSYEDCYTNSNRIYKLIEKEEQRDGIHYNVYMSDITTQLKALSLR